MTNLSVLWTKRSAPHFMSLKEYPQDRKTQSTAAFACKKLLRLEARSLSKEAFGRCLNSHTETLRRKGSNTDSLRRNSSKRLNKASDRSRTFQTPKALFGLGSEAPAESIPLEPIKTEEELDAALKKAEEEGHALLIDWMATWCRKCIYLLPKMEKLSGEFQDVKFYMVNVNEVPGALVKRGGIQKMPTIQLWRHNEKVGEVIGGHKAWMVMDEIREMINNDGTASVTSS